MTIQKNPSFQKRPSNYGSGLADVTQTFCRRSADNDADLAADVRSPGSPQSDVFQQKGIPLPRAEKALFSGVLP